MSPARYFSPTRGAYGCFLVERSLSHVAFMVVASVHRSGSDAMNDKDTAKIFGFTANVQEFYAFLIRQDEIFV